MRDHDHSPHEHHGYHHNCNLRARYLHVLTDALISALASLCRSRRIDRVADFRLWRFGSGQAAVIARRHRA